MARYRIGIDKYLCDEIEQAFYEKNAAKEFVDGVDENSNTYVASYFMDKYVQNGAKLSKLMDRMEKDILGELFQSFVYQYSMDFTNTGVVLTTEAPSVHSVLIGMGWDNL